MKLEDVAQACLDSSLHVKRKMVADDPQQIAWPVIEAWRAGHPVATVFLEHAPPEMIDHILFAVGTGMRADILAVSIETLACVSADGINPDTGRQWEPGDLGTYYQKHGADDVVQDQLNVTVVNAAGDLFSRGQCFRVVQSSFGVSSMSLGEVVDFDTRLEDVDLAGAVPEVLLAAMNSTADMSKLVMDMVEGAGVSILEATVLADWYAVETFGRMGCTAALTTDDVQYAEALKAMTSQEMVGSFEQAFQAAAQRLNSEN